MALVGLVPAVLGTGPHEMPGSWCARRLLPRVPAGTSAVEDTAPHDLHVAYGDLAVEGSVVAGRLRFFKDDLERALGPFVGADALSLAPSPEADALVLRYLRERLVIRVSGAALEPELAASGEDELDREPVWWVLVQYRAASPVLDFTVRNVLLFELFDDQRNVMKFVHFPDETPRTFYFAPGEDEHRVRFGGGWP
jgi:hypothetical protein